MNPSDFQMEASSLGRRMYEGLRASDMRYEGAHLLAEYIVQAARMFEVAQSVIQKNADLVQALDDQRAQLEELATVTPHMLSSAEKRLAESTDRQVAAIQAAGHAQFNALQSMMVDLKAEHEQLQASRAAADLQQNHIRRAQERLDRERNEFNSMSLLRRIFART